MFIQAQIKENIKAPRHWPLCGNSPVTGEFLAQMACNAENVSIWWRHHDASNFIEESSLHMYTIACLTFSEMHWRAAVASSCVPYLIARLYIGTDCSLTAWWRHQMETFSALLAICAENSPVPGEFSAQRPVTLSFDVFFDLQLNKQLNKQSRAWWFETPSGSLWRQCNEGWTCCSDQRTKVCVKNML